jgi:hypothetical protein
LPRATQRSTGLIPFCALVFAVPLWNSGDMKGCSAVYRDVCVRLRGVDVRFRHALDAAGSGSQAGDSTAGWIYRSAFDSILDLPTHLYHALEDAALEDMKERYEPYIKRPIACK